MEAPARGMWHRTLSAVLFSVTLSGCACCAPCARLHDRSSSVLLSRWLADHPMQWHEEIAAAPLLRTASSSMHVVQVRNQEPLHLHARHDLKLILCRGAGTLLLGPRTLRLKPGDVVAIARGTPHAFVNTAFDPAALFIVFTPPLDEPDRVPVR